MARALDPDLTGPLSFPALLRAIVPSPRSVPAATADTPTQADEHQVIAYGAAGEVTVTPPTAAVAPDIKAGFSTKLVALGAGGVTVAAGVGDTLLGADGIAQGKAATLTLLSEAAGARTWLLDGQNA